MKDIISDFKLLRNNPELVYLDYAATTFMPDAVLSAWKEYNEHIGVSLNRSSGWLSQKSTEIYENSKGNILKFFGADEEYIIAFSKNATESLNLLSYCYCSNLKSGDIILISPYEHHSNILPLKRFANEKGAIILSIPIKPNGELKYSFINTIDKNKIKIISLNYISNVNSHQVDLLTLYSFINRETTKVILDISQAVGHMKLDLKEMNADAYAMSAHKMYGPKNIGGAIIRKKDIDKIPPFLLGGGMVWNSLSKEPEWHKDEHKFVAGTFDIGLIYSWSKACDYLKSIGMDYIREYELSLFDYVYDKAIKCPNISLIPSFKGSIISFVSKKHHAHDLAEMLNTYNIEIRTGHMCAQSILNCFNLTSLCRISWGLGTQLSHIDKIFKLL